jgi:hypothetical protein
MASSAWRATRSRPRIRSDSRATHPRGDRSTVGKAPPRSCLSTKPALRSGPPSRMDPAARGGLRPAPAPEGAKSTSTGDRPTLASASECKGADVAAPRKCWSSGAKPSGAPVWTPVTTRERKCRLPNMMCGVASARRELAWSRERGLPAWQARAGQRGVLGRARSAPLRRQSPPLRRRATGRGAVATSLLRRLGRRVTSLRAFVCDTGAVPRSGAGSRRVLPCTERARRSPARLPTACSGRGPRSSEPVRRVPRKQRLAFLEAPYGRPAGTPC